jgi:hypothetical protein
LNPTIRVRIGNGEDNEVLYHIRQTRAPKAYDGFGTIELQDVGGDIGRFVLIRDEHFNWQSGRYSSGMFACAAPDAIDAEDVKKVLWQRLLGNSK